MSKNNQNNPENIEDTSQELSFKKPGQTFQDIKKRVSDFDFKKKGQSFESFAQKNAKLLDDNALNKGGIKLIIKDKSIIDLLIAKYNEEFKKTLPETKADKENSNKNINIFFKYFAPYDFEQVVILIKNSTNQARIDEIQKALDDKQIEVGLQFKLAQSVARLRQKEEIKRKNSIVLEKNIATLLQDIVNIDNIENFTLWLEKLPNEIFDTLHSNEIENLEKIALESPDTIKEFLLPGGEKDILQASNHLKGLDKVDNYIVLTRYANNLEKAELHTSAPCLCKLLQNLTKEELSKSQAQCQNKIKELSPHSLHNIKDKYLAQVKTTRKLAEKEIQSKQMLR